MSSNRNTVWGAATQILKLGSSPTSFTSVQVDKNGGWCSIHKVWLGCLPQRPNRPCGGQVTQDSKAWPHRSLWLIILGGFALRLFRLGEDSLWYDETVSAHLASKGIPGLIAHTAGDIHPPGYYLLLHAWTGLVGDSEFGLTFLSLAFGVLLIPLGYTLARRLRGRKIALWSALLIATSPFNLWYAQEVRMYTLGAALGLVTLWCAIQLSCPLAPQTGRGWDTSYLYAVGYVLAAAAGLYVLYYFGFLLVVLNLLVIGRLLRVHRSRRLPAWLLAQVAALALYLPWLPIAWRQATNPPVPPWRDFIPLHTMLIESWTALSLGQSVRPGQVWPVLLIVGALFLLGLQPQINKHIRSPSSNLQTSLLLVAYTFGPLALIYLVSLLVPLYHVRYLFTYSPPFYILLGSGLAWLARRARPIAIVAAVITLVGATFSIREYHTNTRYTADDFRAAADFIGERWRPGDVVLINAGYAYTGFLYYYDRPIAGPVRLVDYQSADPAAPWPDRPLLLTTGTIGGDPQLGWGNPDSDFYATTQSETAAALTRLTQAFPRVWMLRIYDTVTDPGGFIRDWLAANTTPFEDQLFSGESSMRVQGFMSTNQPPPPQGTQIALEGGITLVGWEVRPAAGQPAGEPLDVVLWWGVEVPVTPDAQWATRPYAVSLKLWGTTDNEAVGGVYLAAQADEWPVGSLFLTSEWPPGSIIRHPMRLWLPPDLSPDQYGLEVEFYDPITVQPLSRRDGQGHTIPLGPVMVTSAQ
jgi:mannosyltransferase